MMTPLNILAVGIIIYLIWAAIYHKRKKSLTFALFMEYLLTALLTVILLTGVIF